MYGACFVWQDQRPHPASDRDIPHLDLRKYFVHMYALEAFRPNVNTDYDLSAKERTRVFSNKRLVLKNAYSFTAFLRPLKTLRP